jgi:hypothetical protein
MFARKRWFELADVADTVKTARVYFELGVLYRAN